MASIAVDRDEDSQSDSFSTTNTIFSLGRLAGGAEDDGDGDVDDDNLWEVGAIRRPWLRKLLKKGTFVVVMLCWCFFTYLLLVKHERVKTPTLLSVAGDKPLELRLPVPPTSNEIGLKLAGPFKLHLALDASLRAVTESPIVDVVVQLVTPAQDLSALPEKKNVSELWRLNLVPESRFDSAILYKRERTIELSDWPTESGSSAFLQLCITTTAKTILPLQLQYDAEAVATTKSAIYASLILLLLYVMLFTGLVNRTLAALLTCTLGISILAMLEDRPTLPTIVTWFDVDAMLTVFGMSIIVSIFSETGILDYLAVRSYELANGHIWPILNTICLISLVGAALLDNITMMLIMSPITIRLCEVIQLNPVPVLTAIILWCNVACALTPFGDQPTSAIAMSIFVTDAGVDYGTFMLHMAPGVLLAYLQTYLHLRIQYHNSNKMRFTEAHEVERLRHVIKLWKHAAMSVPMQSKGEKAMQDTVMTKVHTLRVRVKRLGKMPKPPTHFEETLLQLKDHFRIRNRPLLIKCFVTLTFVLIALFQLPYTGHMTAGWVSLLGAMLLLIIADIEDLEGVLSRIAWSTLLFIGSFFVITETVFRLGLMDVIRDFAEQVVRSAPEDQRLTVAILVIVWVSALSSALLDNLAVANMLLNMTYRIAEVDDLNLPLMPMLWALTFGTCFGANGTIVGSICNILTVGVVEDHGYTFTFMAFFKTSFPIMIGNVIMASIYLLVAHVVYQWH